VPTQHLDITTPDGVANAYFTRPDGSGPVPGVLLYSDALGLRPSLEQLADRVAAAGYAVLAPNVYYRESPDPVGHLPRPVDLSRWSELAGLLGPLMQSMDNTAVLRDAEAYLGFLAASPDVAEGPAGVTGYCMGTRLALRAAEAFPERVAAVGAFHGGGLATDAPDSPHLGLGTVRAEVYLGHADHDPGMPPEQVARLDAALDEAGITHRTEVYPDAPHGYAMADTTAFREDAAERHLAELVALLARTLARD